MIAKEHIAVIVMLAALGMARIATSDTDPVSRWKFNEGAGASAVDSATSTNYGSLVNMNTNTCWTNGIIGKALLFDGTNDYVRVENNPRLNITNEITIEAWIKKDVLSASPWVCETIATKGCYTYNIGIVPAWYGSNRVYMMITSADGLNVLTIYGETVLASNQWYHLAGTYRPGIARLYLNGQPDGVKTGVVQGIWTNTAWLSIGSQSSYQNAYYFNGIIDDLRIYNRALDTEEIRSHYQSESNNCGWWKFNEGVGNKAWDSSGATNTGALTYMATNTCWVTGIHGKALKFDGTNDYVRVENNPTLNPTNEVTIEALIKTDVLLSTPWVASTIATKGYYSYNIGITPAWGGTNRAYLTITPSAGGVVTIYGETVLTSNQWYHLAGTYQPGLARLYVNGQLDGVKTSAVAGIWTNLMMTSWLSIGSESSYINAYYFNGIIDNLRIYNRAWSADELYNAYRDGFTCGQWRFDEGSGTQAYDASGVGNHGVLSNMNTASCWVPGVRDKALQFDGINDVVVCTNAGSLSATNEVSVEAWVKPDTSADYHVIACRGTNSYFLAVHAGKAFFAVGKADGSDWNAAVEGATTLDGARWNHLAGTYTPGTARVYVNGVQDGVGTGAVENIYAANAPLTIGGTDTTGGSTYFFNGTIDNVRVYQHCLAPIDLYQAYSSDCLCGDWRFDDGSGAMAIDSSGMGNVGTLENMSASDYWVMGTIGRGLALDGVDDYVDCGNGAGLSITNEISVSAWVKPDTRSGYHVIAAKGDCTYFLATSSGKPYFAIGNANGSGWNVSILGTNVLNSNRWVHVAGTYNKTNGMGRLYVNGVLDSYTTGTAGTIGANTKELSLGSYSSYTEDYFFQGTLDEIRIYTRALAADEIYNQCQNEGGEYGFGCEGNPTGNPIGGGAGYSDVVTTYTYYVTNAYDMCAALAAATNGDVVYVADDAVIDLSAYGYHGGWPTMTYLTNYGWNAYGCIEISEGVTLASGRGVDGSSGGLLYTTNSGNYPPLFWVVGDNVRVTGLRLQGPQPDPGTNTTDPSSGIRCYGFAGMEVDNCEVSGWPLIGIELWEGATGVYIHHNDIHHCQRLGYGYGVCLSGDQVDCVVEANQFDYMRHSIASSGFTNDSYEARFNLVLEHSISHGFDQHGQNYDGTYYAGGTTLIHHNTFETEYSVCIRGMPYVGAWIYNNSFNYASDEKTVRQLGPPYGNMDVFINVFTTNRVLEIETPPDHIQSDW